MFISLKLNILTISQKKKKWKFPKEHTFFFSSKPTFPSKYTISFEKKVIFPVNTSLIPKKSSLLPLILILKDTSLIPLEISYLLLLRLRWRFKFFFPSNSLCEEEDVRLKKMITLSEKIKHNLVINPYFKVGSLGEK